MRKKCERSLNILKVLSNTAWGADRTSLLRIYRAVIRSKLDYGSIVYGSASKTTLQKLNTVHHFGLRLASGAFRTSPVESLFVDCCEVPLDLRRKTLSLQYYFSLSSHLNHPFHKHITNPSLIRLCQSRSSCIPPFHLRIKKLLSDFNLKDIEVFVADPPRPPWEDNVFKFLNPFKDFKKNDTADTIFIQLFKHHRECLGNYIPIFTDGSKSSASVSCAFVIEDRVYSHKLHPAFSIFSAEILSIYHALENLTKFQRNKFIVYTDSLSVLHSLSSLNHSDQCE